MTIGRYKIEAAMDTIVLDVFAVQSALVREVLAELFIDV